MSGETYICIIGTLTKDPEQKFYDSGSASTRITVVTNARKFDNKTNQWVKQAGKFWDAQAWNQGKALMADNVANTLKKGDTVIVYGELETREYETAAGEKRRADQIRIEGIGKDLRWHQAYANEVPATAAADQSWGGNEQPAGGWGNSSAQNSGGWGTGPTGEPAF
jgi:single-strand DNA-binding protein